MKIQHSVDFIKTCKCNWAKLVCSRDVERAEHAKDTPGGTEMKINDITFLCPSRIFCKQHKCHNSSHTRTHTHTNLIRTTLAQAISALKAISCSLFLLQLILIYSN